MRKQVIRRKTGNKDKGEKTGAKVRKQTGNKEENR